MSGILQATQPAPTEVGVAAQDNEDSGARASVEFGAITNAEYEQLDGQQPGSSGSLKSSGHGDHYSVKADAPTAGEENSSQSLDVGPDKSDSSYQIDSDISDEEVYYDPPTDISDVAHLHSLVDGLEVGESELESDALPPSLFTTSEHVPAYQQISHLKLQLQSDVPKQYMDYFERAIQDDVLMIGNISLEDVQEEEKKLRDEHIRYQQQEAELATKREEKIMKNEEAAKKRVASELRERRKHLARMAEVARQKERLQMQWVHKAFKKAENRLVRILNQRKAEVKTMYGDLTVTEGEYGGTKGRRWKVDWSRTPQPIQVKLKSLRGVKDKLPGGRYVVVVSLYNRLGGSLMKWSNLKGQKWGGATLPVIHNGNFFNTELKLDQSLFTILPSQPDIRPGMVLVFEIFLLRGAVVSTDRCVGWGCFPISDGEFNVIEGKYKVPCLRGELELRVDKFEKIEKLIASDVDHWLCNVYFEVIRLPRYLAGQTEFEVELQYSSNLLNYPDRVNTQDEEYRDGVAPIKSSVNDSQLIPLDDAPSSSTVSLQAPVALLNSASGQPRMSSSVRKTEQFMGAGSASSSTSNSIYAVGMQRPMTTYGSRHVKKDKSVKLNNSGSSSDEFDNISNMKKDDEFLPVTGEPGLFYKRHLNSPLDIYSKKMYTLLPKTEVLSSKKLKVKLTPAQELLLHTASVKQPFSEKGRPPNVSGKRMSYVGRQFLTEVGLSRCFSKEFWLMLIVFVFTFFLRIYTHYIGQWIVLNSIDISVNKFEFLPYTVTVAYQSSLLSTAEELVMVAVGPIIIFGCFVLAIIVSWLSQLLFGSFPDIGSKFIITYGMQSFLDPIFILLVDACLGTYTTDLVEKVGGDNAVADSAKLYWHFLRTEGSGIGGIILTVVIYIFIFFASAVVLYMYFLRLHNNGRMLDVYWRLHCADDELFVPYDLEVSHLELIYIVKKAEQWRGEEGERRKVAVYDYVWEEEEELEEASGESGDGGNLKRHGNKKEITTHIAIHTIHLDGLRELYRHFLRLPDGALVEVFGDMTVVPGVDKGVTSALHEGAKKVEDLLGSQESLRKVRGRRTVFTRSGFHDDHDSDVLSETGDAAPFTSGSAVQHAQRSRPPTAQSERQGKGSATSLRSKVD